MDALARITLALTDGRSVSIRARDIRDVATGNSPGQSVVTMDDGREYQTSSAVATVHTAIDTLWDEYTAALGDPA